MPSADNMPDVTVEVAWNAGFNTPATSRLWTAIEDQVEADHEIKIRRGRGNELEKVRPSTLDLRVDNRDGRFTPGNASSPYYPNVKRGRPIRVRARWPLTQSGNLLTANQASAETDASAYRTTGLSFAYTGATWASSSTRATDGTKSVLVTWPTITGGSFGAMVGTNVTLTKGRTYTLSADVYVPAGSPDVRLQVVGLNASGDDGNAVHAWGNYTSTKGAWTRISCTFTADASRAATAQLYLVGVQTGSATAGQQVWVDSVMLDETSTALTPFTLNPPPIVERFLGYLDTIPIDWPGGTTNFATVDLSATSRGARLGLDEPLVSIVEEEMLSDGPTLYFPLSEPADSTTAGNIAPPRTDILTLQQYGTGGTFTFANSIGPGTDDLPAPTFTPVGSSNGYLLGATLATPIVSPTDTVIELECFFVTSDSFGSMVQVSDDTGTTFISIEIYSSRVRIWVNNGTPAIDWPLASANGLLHHAHGRIVVSGSGAIASVMVDGGARVSGGLIAAMTSFPTLNRLVIGGALDGAKRSLFSGTLAHAWVRSGTTATPDARIADHAAAGLTGFTSDTPGARIGRYARFAGIPTAELDLDAGVTPSISHIPTTNQTAAQLMEAVETTEDGVLFDGRDGRLTFRGRDRRWNATSSFTLDLAAGDVEDGFRPVLDDQQMSNDVTGNRPAGAEQRATNDASIADQGTYASSITIYVNNDNDVASRIQYLVNRYGVPRVKIPNLTVDLLNSNQTAALLAADIGTKLTLANQPAQAPASSADYFVEGYTETIKTLAWTLEFNTSADELTAVWQLDSPTRSVLDTSTVLAY